MKKEPKNCYDCRHGQVCFLVKHLWDDLQRMVNWDKAGRSEWLTKLYGHIASACDHYEEKPASGRDQ